jgi:PhnB protein
MQINAYVTFNGQCEEAFKFYEQVLKGKIAFMTTWGEMPDAAELPDEARKTIMHATLTVGDQTLLGADSPPGTYQPPQGLSVAVHHKETGECKRIFEALAAEGKVQMPFQKTFWSAGFGMCVDKFGVPWMINSECEPD